MENYNQMLLLTKDIYKKIMKSIEGNLGSSERKYFKLDDGRVVTCLLDNKEIPTIKIENVRDHEESKMLDSLVISNNTRTGELSALIYIFEGIDEYGYEINTCAELNSKEEMVTAWNGNALTTKEIDKSKLYLLVIDGAASTIKPLNITNRIVNNGEEKIKTR